MKKPEAQQALLVFAKAPVPGRVKTRLAQSIGNEQSADVHSAMMRDTLNHCIDPDGSWDTQLWCAPDINHEYFQFLHRLFSISLFEQSGETLGHRMYNAFATALKKYERVVIIGTDCPVLDRNFVQRIFRDLREGYDAVITPAEDGGYVLIAMSSVDWQVFKDVDWGNNTVMSQTRQRLNGLPWRWRESQVLWDVDCWEDYQRYQNLLLKVNLEQ